MTPSPFLIQLAILLLPGVLWTHLDAKFGSRSSPSQIEFVFRSLLFGLASYVVVYALYWAIGLDFSFIDIERAQTTVVIDRHIVGQIAAATAVGFSLSVLWLYAINYKWMTRFLQKIGATKTYGDEDVWDFVLNSRSAESEYVHVRDFDNKIVYAGWVTLFSETGKMRELLLNSVEIYDFDGALLFEIPRVYIARKPEGMHVEFPATPENVAEESNEL
ncbi:UNVERIFIED_ORG: hypothetical protein J2W19_003137 [Shinella zoogloeoides]|nr:hypothetical protein [Shinella zoogloeoides]